MAFDKTPTTWLPSYASDGTTVSVPIASIPQLNSTDANAATGDFRKIMFAVCKKVYDAWAALATADRPKKMVINKSVSVDPVTGVETQTFTFTFKTTVLTQAVASET